MNKLFYDHDLFILFLKLIQYICNNQYACVSLFIYKYFFQMRIKNQFENSNRMVDFVSCQFAFHYCFESLSQAETMLRNISENLKKGGYFIATIPNAYEIM